MLEARQTIQLRIQIFFSLRNLLVRRGVYVPGNTVKSTKHILRKAHSTLYSAEANEPKRNIAESS